MDSVRTPAQRKADALAMLSGRRPDLWIATASPDGAPHLVPISFSWDGRIITIATAMSTPTARNLLSTRRARLGLGGTRDVVMIDTSLSATIPCAEAPLDTAERYATQAGWDPRSEPDGYAYLLLHPDRIQVWREADELPGRTVMRDGEWRV